MATTKAAKASSDRSRKTKERGNGQGTIFEVGTGKQKKFRWQVTLGYRVDGKRITRSGTVPSRKAAHDAMTQALTDHRRGVTGAPERITVAEYAERCLRRLLDVRPRTVQRYREELAYALERIGSMRLQDVRPQHLKDVMAGLATRQMRRGNLMSPRTQAHVQTRLRWLFREAVSDQIIYTNPIDGVKRAKSARPISAGTSLDFDEAGRFHAIGAALNAAGLCRLWPALFTAVSVGLRRGEVMGLRWSDVNLEVGVLRVRQTRVMGREGIETGTPKTLNSTRDVHLPPSLVAVLAAHREQQNRERAEAGVAWRNTDAVFATVLGEWTHPDNLKRALENIVKWSDPAVVSQPRFQAGVRPFITPETLASLTALTASGERLPGISPHDLRHTYATLALRSGVPVEVVSKVLGHASVSITLDVYRHVLDNERRAAVVDLFSRPPCMPDAMAASLN